MQRTDAATSCTRVWSDGAGRMTGRAVCAGLAFLAGLVVFSPAHAQNQKPGTADQNRVLLDLLNQVDALGRQVRDLRGQVESASNRVDQANDRAQKAEKRQSDLYNDTDARMRRLEQSGKDEAAERKKLLTQVGDLELHIRKLEADIDVQVKKLQTDLDGKSRGSNAGAAATPVSPDLEARVRRLEAALGGSSAPAAELEARVRKLEQAAAAGAQRPAEPPPGSATAPVAAPSPSVTQAPQPEPPSQPAAAQPEPAGASLPPASLNSPPDQLVVSRAYEQALARQRSGDAAGAVQAFQSFLRQYPRHELAPNAQYWLGEAYFRQGDYASAIAAQQKLLVTYPDHLKVPDAMLILANAQSASGDARSARKTLEDLIAKHPLSEAAEKGRQRLAKLR